MSSPEPRAAAISRVVIDTDPALGAPGADIDDGLAIALALRSPSLRVEGITIVNGNVDLATGLSCAHTLLERLDRTDVAIHAGADAPLHRDMHEIHKLFASFLAPDDHSETVTTRTAPNPIGSISTTSNPNTEAARFLVDTIMANPGDITVIALGPMTNLAHALMIQPEVATAVREFVMMAGSATTYAQNITTVADFNAYVDPEALEYVLHSGANVRMVGLDQTSRVLLTRDHAASLRDTGDSFAGWVADCTDAWITFLGRAFPNRPEHETSCFLHDPLTVAAVVCPDLLTWQPAAVEVECESTLTRGLVVADRALALFPQKQPNALVAVDTDVDAFLRLFLTAMAN